MTRRISKLTMPWLGAATLIAAGASDVSARVFSIECEHTRFPSCCTAIHESAGANANYFWTASKGWLERDETSYPWNWHHCGLAIGGFNLHTSIDRGTAFGAGKSYCPAPGLL